MFKKIILVLILLCFNLSIWAQAITFPKSFEVGIQHFPGMKPAVITKDAKQVLNIATSKGIVTNKKTIGLMLNNHAIEEKVKQVYYEIYQGIADDSRDAGIIIAAFENKTILDNNLKYLQKQTNSRYLIKDEYLLIIWSDKGREEQQKTLNRIQNVFIENINAVLLEIDPELNIEFAIPTEAAENMDVATKIFYDASETRK